MKFVFSTVSCVAFLCMAVNNYAQQPYYNQRPDFLKANSIWAFGVNAGLDFNSGSVVPIGTQMFAQEGCASVADPASGKLLFYSNGGQVWNANHQMMPNGHSLLGNALYRVNDTVYSTLQGVSIVPVINDPGKYYLFSLSGLTSGGPKPEGTLFYNVVDMNLNNGLGDIVSGKKNIALDKDTLSEAMVAIPGDNCDIWLVTHHRIKHQFKAYHITKDGIDPVPVISNTGYFTGQYGIVTMAVSPDRSKIVLTNANQGALLGQFDPATGQVANAMRAASGGYFSAAFSPDNSKLYFNTAVELHQYDLGVYDSVTIHNSRIVIASAGAGKFAGNVRKTFYVNIMRLYNDTIYSGFYGDIHRINQPNLAGTACDFQLNAIKLLAGDTCSGSLNSDVVWSLVDTIYESAQVTSCIHDADITLNAPQGFDGYEWEDGSTSATRTVTASGTYWVTSKDFCRPRVDTFKIQGLNFPAAEITINVHELGTTAVYDTYQWMFAGQVIPGADDSKYVVKENGGYQVIVTSAEGCVDTSDVYMVTNVDESSIENRDKAARLVRVYPNPAKDVVYIRAPFAVNAVLTGIDGRIMKKWNGADAVEISGFSEGMYFLRLLDSEGRLLKVEKVNIRH